MYGASAFPTTCVSFSFSMNTTMMCSVKNWLGSLATVVVAVDSVVVDEEMVVGAELTVFVFAAVPRNPNAAMARMRTMIDIPKYWPFELFVFI